MAALNLPALLFLFCISISGTLAFPEWIQDLVQEPGNLGVDLKLARTIEDTHGKLPWFGKQNHESLLHGKRAAWSGLCGGGLMAITI